MFNATTYLTYTATREKAKNTVQRSEI